MKSKYVLLKIYYEYYKLKTMMILIKVVTKKISSSSNSRRKTHYYSSMISKTATRVQQYPNTIRNHSIHSSIHP